MISEIGSDKLSHKGRIYVLQALKLDAKELKQREVVHVDIVKDHVDAADYKKEEDPALFKSEKTGRGPLNKSNWMVWLSNRAKWSQ